MVSVQYGRTQRGRMLPQKLSLGGIHLTSLEMFAVSSCTRVSLPEPCFSQLGESGPAHLTIRSVGLDLSRAPALQSGVVCCRRHSFLPALGGGVCVWNLGSQPSVCFVDIYCHKKNPFHRALTSKRISCVCAPALLSPHSPALATAALSPRIVPSFARPAARTAGSIIPCMTHASTCHTGVI